ncbi:hypothetical protein ACT2E5_04325 [Burkholderia vietnamiensis]|uniref:hypothetical protein n=1 Tax=Burkholderia vietnamiensis TaxID=60552 RepID=UPI00402AB0D5
MRLDWTKRTAPDRLTLFGQHATLGRGFAQTFERQQQPASGSLSCIISTHTNSSISEAGVGTLFAMQPITKLNPYWARLEIDLGDTSGIIVPNGRNEAEYFEGLRASIRRHATAAEWVSATVVAPGFKHRELGSKVAGYLLARDAGYWLVFEPEEGEYYCFWGTDPDDLGAYGVCGNPLYCWWE